MTTKVRETTASYRKSTLDNGLRIITTEMPHTRSVSLCVFVGVGSRYETEDQAGISHFIEHMVFKGTERRPTPEEISGTIEGTGGVLNAGTEQELTVYWCKVAEPHFKESLDLLLDMLRNSVYETQGLEKERMVIVEEISMINDYPNSKVDALIDEMLWPDHPLGRDIAGTRESIMGITREQMLDFMADFYSPSNIVISVAGNVSHDEVVEQVADFSEGWPSSTSSTWAPFHGKESGPISRVEYRKTEQTHLSIALPGISLVHPDRYALDLLSVILGEGMSSRLFVEVRERQGLAYDVHSGVAHFLDTGAFVVSAGVDPKRLYDAVETILEQIGEVREGVPDDELEKAKRLSTGRLQLRMEDTRAVAGWTGNQELLLGEILGAEEVVNRVNAITPSDVRKVANDILVGDKLAMAVVGRCRGQRRLEQLLKL